MTPACEPLIHIGFHKTGSTWLQRYIFTDAERYTQVTPRKVIDEAFILSDQFAFDPEAARSRIQGSLDDAARLGTVPVISHEELSGAPILNGWGAAPIADRLHATFPEARILIVIREQRSMMLSLYKQYVKARGTEPIGRLWRGYSVREQRRPTPGLEILEYHRIIGYYQRLFGKERVLVLPFELLRSDDERFLREISSFVGVPAPTEFEREPRNVSPPGILISFLRVSNIVLRAIKYDSLVGVDVEHRRIGWRRWMIQRLGPKLPAVLSRPFDRKLDQVVGTLVSGRFGQSNCITSSMTGLDLASYGYETS